jgi:ABC-type transport system involved in multi-copper enzyme maturation permease subunit
MPADAPRQVFRPSPPNYVIGWVLTIIFVLLGLAFVLGGPDSGDWVWPEIMGAVLLLLAVFVLRAMATSVLIATRQNWSTGIGCSAGTRSSGPRSGLSASVRAAAAADGRR